MSVLAKTLMLALLLQPVVGKEFFDHGDWVEAAEKGGTGVETFTYLLEVFDNDEDKALSLDEVLKSTGVHNPESDGVPYRVFINAFRHADVDGDEKINGPEFKRMLAEVKKYHDKHQGMKEKDQEKEDENDSEEEYPVHGTGMVRGRWLDIARSSGKPGGGATGAMEKYDINKDYKLSKEEIFGDRASEHKLDPSEDAQVSAVVMTEAFKVADKDQNHQLTDTELVDFLRQIIWFDHAYQKHTRVMGHMPKDHPLADKNDPFANARAPPVPGAVIRGRWLDIAHSQGQAGGGAYMAFEHFDRDKDKRLSLKDIMGGPRHKKDVAEVQQVNEAVVREAYKAASHHNQDPSKGLDRPEVVTFLNNIIWLHNVHGVHGSVESTDAMLHVPVVHIRGKWLTLAGSLGQPGGGAKAAMEQMDFNDNGKLTWQEIIGEPKKKKDWANAEEVTVQVLSKAFEVADENADLQIDGTEIHSFLKHIISYNNFAANKGHQEL